jgi:hypothetical protein
MTTVISKASDIFQEYSAKYDNLIKRYFGFILDNKYINAAVIILLILYAGVVAPKLPESVAKMFDRPIVKMIFAFMIVFVAGLDPTVALLVSIGFIVTLMTINTYKFQTEMMESIGGRKHRFHATGCEADGNDKSEQGCDYTWDTTYSNNLIPTVAGQDPNWGRGPRPMDNEMMDDGPYGYTPDFYASANLDVNDASEQMMHVSQDQHSNSALARAQEVKQAKEEMESIASEMGEKVNIDNLDLLTCAGREDGEMPLEGYDNAKEFAHV